MAQSALHMMQMLATSKAHESCKQHVLHAFLRLLVKAICWTLTQMQGFDDAFVGMIIRKSVLQQATWLTVVDL